ARGLVSGKPSCYMRGAGRRRHFVACGRGGIGRRAALRSLWGNPWKFESSRPHHLPHLLSTSCSAFRSVFAAADRTVAAGGKSRHTTICRGPDMTCIGYLRLAAVAALAWLSVPAAADPLLDETVEFAGKILFLETDVPG